jgi:uncharacterized membrane protein
MSRVHPADGDTGRSTGSGNLAAVASLASAVGAIALVLVSRHVQTNGIPLAAVAAPTGGVLASVLGIVGLVRANRSGSDRTVAAWGLGLGIIILALSVILGLFALFLSGLPDNGF